MSCEEIREELPAYIQGEIEGDRRTTIARHLESCAACQAEAAATREVIDGVAAADDAAVDRRWKQIVHDAIAARASDIHLLPGKGGMAVRFRIDGVLHEQEQLGMALGRAIVTALKVASECDATLVRSPQDGRIHIRHRDTNIDVRLSTMPTCFGERVTLRLLRQSDVLLGLEGLGLSADQVAALREFLAQPWGLFFATGPTGSGKTTLHYSLLRELDAAHLNVVTIEDPVEYLLPGISQTHVNRKAGLGFCTAVRALLRHDPDVILCGEIRDLETAEVLIQAAITGHTVLTTLHTTTAPEVFRRLVNMGVEPFLIADTVKLICAMRLVRKVCDACREEYEPGEVETAWLRGQSFSLKGRKLTRGRGCDECSQTGYRGRLGLFEVLKMTDPLRDLIVRRADAREMDSALRAAGHVPLAKDGLEKISAGITTTAEVMGSTAGL